MEIVKIWIVKYVDMINVMNVCLSLNVVRIMGFFDS